MASPFSIRIEQEDQEKLKKLISDSGLSQKDFFQTFLKQYELIKAQENLPMINNDIQELEAATKRINTIYLNIAEKFQLLEIDKNNIVSQLNAEHSNKINELQLNIEELKKHNAEQAEIIKNKTTIEESLRQELEEAKAKNNELQFMFTEKTNILEEYRVKLNHFEESQKTIETLTQQVGRHEQEVSEMKLEFEKKIIEIEKASNEALTQKINELMIAKPSNSRSRKPAAKDKKTEETTNENKS